MAATACFGSERIVQTVLLKDSSFAGKMASHAIGGVMGGAVLGLLYQQRPLRGALFFAPIMMAVAVAEDSFEQGIQQMMENKRDVSKASNTTK